MRQAYVLELASESVDRGRPHSTERTGAEWSATACARLVAQMRQVLRSIGVILLSSAAVPIGVTVTVLAAFIFLPLPAALPAPTSEAESQISHVYALDDRGRATEIAVFRKFEQKIPVRPEDIPLHMKQAVVASEDRNFYSHGGVDVRGSARALWADLRNQSFEQGGSTITQQYVKNVYTDKDRTIVRKVREAILASQLDRQFEKDEILFRYLEEVYLGEGAYGVGAASETYFRKPVTQLTISEAAMLAGLIPAPSFYEPRGNPQGAELKRKIVLENMLEQEYITQQQYDEALAQPVWFAGKGPPPGPVTLVHPPLQQVTKYPYFVDYVRRYLVAKYGEKTVDQGGLQIQTTMDIELQEHAERTLADGLKGVPAPIEMGMASIEPPTGYVKALVGGRDFYNGPNGQVNLALGKCPRKPAENVKVVVPAPCWEDPTTLVQGGGTGRQSGSSWKPYVLAAAFAKGYPPTRSYSAPGVYRIPNCKGPKGCEIGNYEGGAFGSADLRVGTWKSINTVYAQLIRDVGIKETAEMAAKLGITSAWYSPRQHGEEKFGLAYALGVLDISPLEQAAAYGVFAARGMRAAPTPVLKVVDAKGKVLEDNTKPRAERVIEEIVADNVTSVLRGVITSGTGTRADIGRPAAGKTGTTNEYHDAWFAGYTPTLSTAVWLGNAKGLAPLRLAKCGGGCAGGTLPAATWKVFMSKAVADVPVTDFSEAAPIKPLADALKRNARGGIDPGDRRSLSDTGAGGPYEFPPAKPRADAPVVTTTTSDFFYYDEPPATTTTTSPRGGGGGGLFP